LGRTVARLGLGFDGVLDSRLPSPIASTIYARLGDIPAAIIIAAGLLIALSRRMTKRTS
jgi:apolipoprotein N-acyltransferase